MASVDDVGDREKARREGGDSTRKEAQEIDGLIDLARFLLPVPEWTGAPLMAPGVANPNPLCAGQFYCLPFATVRARATAEGLRRHTNAMRNHSP